MQNNPLLIEITRGDVAESAHRGTFVVVNDQHVVVASGGDIDHPIYPRSAVKPLQALPLIESGAADRWRLSDCELALACASHNAESRHTDSILAWLKKAGLSERDLLVDRRRQSARRRETSCCYRTYVQAGSTTTAPESMRDF